MASPPLRSSGDTEESRKTCSSIETTRRLSFQQTVGENFMQIRSRTSNSIEHKWNF